MKKSSLIFIIACIIVCCIPFVAMTFNATTVSTENKTLASFPSVYDADGGLNLKFFEQFEEYFNDHFAFRNELVYADSQIQTKLFKVSNMDTVIYGNDGWLYYSSTLDDYLGQNNMSDRQIYNLAHNLSIVQQYIEDKGIAFDFTIAPNKNTLYGENMPYYYSHIVDGDHNVDMLTPALEEAGVNYTNLFELFENEDECLYLKRDSHWTIREQSRPTTLFCRI